MNKISTIKHSESGFTIIEVLVATVLLAVGIAGTLKIADNANALTSNARAREGAINLARQLAESARTLPYADLQTGQVTTDLRNLPGLAGSGTPWTLNRRRVTFTINVTGCVVDDRSDATRAVGTSPPSGASFCSTPASGAAGQAAPSLTPTSDAMPDDFRMITIQVTWPSTKGVTPACSGAGGGTTTPAVSSNCVTQNVLIQNPAGNLGPGITKVDPSANPVQSPATSTTVTFVVTTSAPASAVKWKIDDGVSSGTTGATDSNNQVSFTWSVPDTDVDGLYNITLQAFSPSSVAGPSAGSTITLNRYVPGAPDVDVTPPGAGVNTRLGTAVEVNWYPNPERDILRYRVYRSNSATPALTGTLTEGCSVSPTKNACVDDGTDPNGSALPATGTVNYYVVAFDNPWSPLSANPLAYTNCPLGSSVTVNPPALWPSSWNGQRPGCPSFTIPVNLGSAPAPPTWPGNAKLSISTTTDGQPDIAWSKPANQGAAPLLYYRIYRYVPGTGQTLQSNPPFSQRYDHTPDAATTTADYVDTAPSASCTAATPCAYFVTAADTNWQESQPLTAGSQNYVTWP